VEMDFYHCFPVRSVCHGHPQDWLPISPYIALWIFYL